MISNIKTILKKIDINEPGHYENKFYVIDLADSNAYAAAYSKLNKNAVNTEYPNYGTNSNQNTVKITNYFELDVNETTYNIFLMADFETDKYKVKIGEK